MKKRLGKVPTFLNNLTTALEQYLPSDWENQGYPSWRMMKKYPWGEGGISIHTTVGGFPSCRLYLSYGVSHDVLQPVFDKIYEAYGWELFRHLNQFGTDTRNCRLNPEIDTILIEDYNYCDYDDAVARLMENSFDRLLGYFEKFSDLKRIRDAKVNRDKCINFSLQIESIVAIDYVLDDIEHLNWYRDRLQNEHEWRKLDHVSEILGIKLW